VTPSQPIGVWDEVREDGRGLWVKGRILDSVARGREAAALIVAGAIDGLSIGYRTVRAAKNDTGQRVLTELDLWEVSLVTFPMLPTARVAAKSDFVAVGDVLRDMALAFEDARVLLAR
jgi:HK97 family phage prohead protease